VNTSQESKLSILTERAQMLKCARAFFEARGILEVDCPALSHFAPVDLHIDIMKVLFKDGSHGYLHSSPEYGMKRLLSEGIGDIYQISHVFRDGDEGKNHNPEFTMVEWYRKELSFEAFVEETLDFCRLFLTALPCSSLTYRDLFYRTTGIDYVKASADSLLRCLETKEIVLSNPTHWNKDALLSLIMSYLIEPTLQGETLHLVTDFPSSQAALAKTLQKADECVGLRFEIYYRGIELANGYHELTDGDEQRQRFSNANRERLAVGKEPLPLDEFFLNALKKGLPECFGVAVGFDRLMMLKMGADSLGEVLPFSWPIA
jgi:elongation factor P--(R)-beta-lysine ligase